MIRRAFRPGLAVLGLALLGLTVARADEPPWHGGYISPPVRAACDRTAALADPVAEPPTPAEATALKGCESAALYYGIGRPADPVAARKCAWVERRQADGGPTLGGDAVLAMLYANGRGVRRNYDQAIRLSCRASWAEAELEARVTHLLSLKANPACSDAHATARPGRKDVCAFDFCDDITSGAMGGICSARDSRLAAVAREARMARFTSGLRPDQRGAYAALTRTMEAYAKAHGGSETDLSGTLRGAFIIEAEDAVRTMFETDLAALASGKAPVATAAELASADAALNAAYKAAMAQTYPEMSGIRHEGIRGAERAWIAYRDAFVRFAAVRWPGVSPEALKTKLTRDRTRLLTELAQP